MKPKARFYAHELLTHTNEEVKEEMESSGGSEEAKRSWRN